jgi:hypothetical protein
MLYFAINPGFTDKTVPHARLYVDGFTNEEGTPEELARVIREGWAVCAQLSGPRRTENFFQSNLGFVDIDEAESVEAVLKHPFVSQYACLVHTTVSHTPDRPRLRGFFHLPRVITDPREMTAVLRSLARRVGGDLAATDATRICCGNRAAECFVLEGGIPVPLLDELIQQSLGAANPANGAIGPRTSTISRLHINPDREVKLANGSTTPFREVTAKAPLHCPFHDDRDPSAYVVTSRSGVNGIHCSACMQTFWPERGGSDDYDFDDFEQEAARAHEFFEKHEDTPFSASDSDAISGLTGCSIILTTKGPVPRELSPGVTFIRSPKGTGKTTGLKALLVREEKVLLIGHRRTLISQSCEQLGLTCYLDEGLTRNDRHKRLGVCLDSLHKVSSKARYDVVVIDESEQVLGHFLSETMDRREGAGRERLFVEFRHRVRKAKKVVALDADLGWTTFHTLTRMVSGSSGRGA